MRTADGAAGCGQVAPHPGTRIEISTGEKKAGRVFFDGDYSQLTEVQAHSLSAMETVADALGVDIHVFQSEVGEDGRRKGANGWYDPSDGSIHIDLFAGRDGKGTMLFTLAHELSHFIRQWSPAKFKILSNFLMERYAESGASVTELVENQMAKARKNGRELSFEAAHEEVVADSLETMLSDGTVMEKLAELKAEDRSLWEKFRDFIREFAAKIRQVYEKLRPDSAEGKIVAQMKEAIEELQNLFVEGLVDASENFAGAQKNTAESGAKYSIRNDIVDANGTEYDRVVELEYSLFNKVKRNGKAYIDFIRNNLIKQKIAVYSNSGEVEIIEFAGEKERVQKDGAKNKHPVIGELTQAKNEIKKLVILNSAETAEISEFAQHSKEHTHQWLDENGWDERISYVMTRDGIVYPAILHIAKTKDGRNILYDINVKIREGVAADKNATSLRAKKQARQAVRTTTPSSETRVSHQQLGVKKKFSDRDSEGNSLSEGQQEYFKNSQVRDQDGNLLVMYRGDREVFTVFDRKKTSYSNLYGRGFYFTNSKNHAGQYGNAKAFYLNIVNPVATDNRTISKPQMRKFLEAVAENEDDFSFENYGYGATVDSVLKSVYSGKSDFAMLYDVSQTAIGDMVAAVELFNKVNGTEYDGFILDTETVIFSSNQAKQVENRNPTKHSDIRYSDRDPDYQKVSKALEQENQKLKEDVSYLKELVKLQQQVTGGTKFTKTSVEAVAKAVRRNAGAQGGVANRPGFGRVVLSKRGAVHTVHHGNGPAKQASFPAIKAVIEKGVEIYRDVDHEGRGFDTVTFSAPIDFFGNPSPLATVVKVFDGANADKTFYIHEICDVEGNYIQFPEEGAEQKNSSTNFVEPTSTVSAADNGIAPKNSIRNPDGNVNKKFSDRDPDYQKVSKALEQENQKLVAPHPGARIEIRQVLPALSPSRTSPPTRGRELKFLGLFQLVLDGIVVHIGLFAASMSRPFSDIMASITFLGKA